MLQFLQPIGNGAPIEQPRERFGVFVGTRPIGQSEVWTRVGPRYVNVGKAAAAAAALDPGNRGRAEVRNLGTDRTVWLAGLWLTGQALQAGQQAVARIGRDHPMVYRIARDAVRAAMR